MLNLSHYKLYSDETQLFKKLPSSHYQCSWLTANRVYRQVHGRRDLIFHFIQIRHGDLTRWQGIKRDYRKMSTPSLPTQPMKGCTTASVSTAPTLYEQQRGFFYFPQKPGQWKSYDREPTSFRPYPRRLGCLTICRCRNKGSRSTVRLSVLCSNMQQLRFLISPIIKPITWRKSRSALFIIFPFTLYEDALAKAGIASSKKRCQDACVNFVK